MPKPCYARNRVVTKFKRVFAFDSSRDLTLNWVPGHNSLDNDDDDRADLT